MWNLKLDANGNVVVKDGAPVYVKEDGSEVAYNVNQAVATIAARNAEAKTHREAAEAATAELAQWKELGTDPAKAKAALELESNIAGKKMIDTGEVQKLKDDINKTWQEKLTAAEKKAAETEGLLNTTLISGEFARSPFVAEKLAVPADMLQSMFGNRFKIQDGKVVGHDDKGNVLHSSNRPGEVADFSEALEIVVNSYPNKDRILKANQASGNNNPGGGGGGPANAKTITRKEYDALGAIERGTKMAAGVKIVG